MDSYALNKIRGSWIFSNSDITNCNNYKNHILCEGNKETLQNILAIMSDSEIFKPKGVQLLGNTIFESNSIIEILDFVFSDENHFGIVGLYGDTTIYTSKYKKEYKNIFEIQEFRLLERNFQINTRSDLMLPMVFNEEKYDFNWNLEQYYLNYERLPRLLKEIQAVLKWDDDSSNEIDYTERGCIQIGYDLFLSEEVITREYERNPNPDFDLEAYLKKMKEAEAKIRESH
jgi:hypothetical protein